MHCYWFSVFNLFYFGILSSTRSLSLEFASRLYSMCIWTFTSLYRCSII